MRKTALHPATEQPAPPRDPELFVAVARSRSFSAAARRFGLSVSSVTRAVGRLEKSLGARLLARSTHGLALTEAGTAWLSHTERWLAEEQAVRAAIDEARAARGGTLRVTVPVFVAERILPQAIARFAAARPEARLDVHASDERADLVGGAFDLALRLGPLPDSTLRSRRLVDFERLLCAAPSLLERLGRPSHPSQLAGLPCLVYGNGPAPAHWTFHRPGEEPVLVPVGGPVRSNNLSLLCQLAEQGLGLLRLPDWVAAPAIQSGGLRRLLPRWALRAPDGSLSLHAVYPGDPGKERLRAAFLTAVSETTRAVAFALRLPGTRRGPRRPPG